MIFSAKLSTAQTKTDTRILFTTFSHGFVAVLPSTWWFFMVGRKEISMPSHQKNNVADNSSCFTISRHFLLLSVNKLEIRPMGQGSALANNCKQSQPLIPITSKSSVRQ